MELHGYIHRYIKPVEAGKPTILLLHGTGGNEDDLIELGHILSPGSGLLSPRGTVSEGGMPRFFRRHSPGVLDIEDLIERAGQLGEFIDAAAREYGFERDNVVAAGYSNGANIAAALLLLRPEALAAAALFHPMLPLTPKKTPDLAGKPIFIGAGEQDPIVPAGQVDELYSLLSDAGAEVTIAWQPGGHQLTAPEVLAATKWLAGLA